MLRVLTIIPAVLAALSRRAVRAVNAAQPLQGYFGCLFHLFLKPLCFLGAPVKLITIKKKGKNREDDYEGCRA